MKHQRGLSLIGLMVGGVVLVLVAVTGMRVLPTVSEYYKILKDCKAAVAQSGPNATVADVKKAFSRYANVDSVDFPVDDLDISKESGQIVVSFGYEKRIPLFRNVSLLIDYQGTTAGAGKE